MYCLIGIPLVMTLDLLSGNRIKSGFWRCLFIIIWPFVFLLLLYFILVFTTAASWTKGKKAALTKDNKVA